MVQVYLYIYSAPDDGFIDFRGCVLVSNGTFNDCLLKCNIYLDTTQAVAQIGWF